MMPLLEARQLVKSYRKRRVVDEVAFQVDPAEIVGLLGPNGAGKTTSFRMVVGMVRPDAGEVRFEDRDITRLPIYKRARRGIAYLPQEPSVFRRLGTRDNLLALLETLPISRAERKRRADALLDDLELTKVARSRAEVLSGGERRRLELARSLVHDPAILLLDEPFAGVDPITVQEIQKILRQLRETKGIAILLTDHNVRETLAITDRSYIIAGGRILRAGRPAELVEDEVVRRTYLGENFYMQLDA
ncbi:MAG: LPS export ABC transporter ATP-binding protein [Planctomycetota bacterium]|nr:LPS export ABC transporter ATP-binding protein [Planctomycetota bacterium]MCB9824702.1 LPS export ABC transporter ATP-binding protein [Planctomycetota bacterium]MCB9899886.1 LPS export ABC transporter ATP-binding protein [Planctomycetota bacterium]